MLDGDEYLAMMQLVEKNVEKMHTQRIQILALEKELKDRPAPRVSNHWKGFRPINGGKDSSDGGFDAYNAIGDTKREEVLKQLKRLISFVHPDRVDDPLGLEGDDTLVALLNALRDYYKRPAPLPPRER